jgi:hypothetical protein
MEEEQIRYEAEKKILEQKAIEDELLAQSIVTKTSESDIESP